MSSAMRTLTSYSGFIVLSLIWGLAFVAIKQADFELAPVNLALIRWLITSVVFLLLLPIVGRPKTRLERKDVPRLLVVAFANVVGYHVFLNYAETSISAGLSALLIALGPVFIVLLSVLLLHEKVRTNVIIAIPLAIFGTLVLSIGTFSANDLASFLGIGAAVVSAFCYALFTVLGKPLVQKYGSAPTTILAGLIGTVMLMPLLSRGFFTQIASLSQTGWTAVLYLSVLSSALGYLLFYGLVSRRAVTRLSIQLYVIPIVSVVGGAILLQEAVTIWTVAGGALMLAAVTLVTRK